MSKKLIILFVLVCLTFPQNSWASVLEFLFYTPPSGTVLNVGTHNLHVDFTPTDSLNASNACGYNISTKPNLIAEYPNSPPVTNGLVVYYDGSLSDNYLVDLSGNNNIGYATSVTSETNQLTGANCINFNGINSKIDVSHNVQTNISSPISIEFIGSINTFSQYGAIVSNLNPGATGWYLSCSGAAPYNYARFSTGTSAGILGFDSGNSLVAGKVYDIVATYDNNIAHIYINGVDSGSSTWSLPVIGSPENITISNCDIGTGLNPCNCSMYTFRLYNRSLSSSEVKQNYNSDRWRFQPPPDDISMIKKLVYGDGGLPRYMGSYAIQQSGDGLKVLDNNLNIYSSIGTPFFQDNNTSKTNCSLAGATINGINWRNNFAARSNAILTYTGNNRSVQNTCLLSNDSFNINYSVTYLGKTQTVQDGLPVFCGDTYAFSNIPYEFYGDGLNTLDGNNVTLYTDNANIQMNKLVIPNSTTPGEGDLVYTNYQTRDAGVTRSSSLELPLSSPQLTPMPVPSGYLGALIFAEHADYTDHDSLRTVMYGTNETTIPIYGKKGFIGNDLNATWSVFTVSSSYGEGLDSPALKSVTDDMYAHGFEIIPHSLTGASSPGEPDRSMAVAYLPWYYTNYKSRNWIDHGVVDGYRNIGLKSEGWNPSSQYYIMDLLQDYHYTYAWFWDPDPSPAILSTSKISSVGLPADIVWQNTNLVLPNGTPIYQWKACAAKAGTALKFYNNNSIDNMLSTYGVSIWHDYWPDNCSGGTAAVPGYYYVQGHPNMINSTFDNLLTNISEQKEAKKLWNPTVSQYIDYWIAARNVEVKCTGVNTYTVVNHNSGIVSGFSMRVAGTYTPKLDGVTLSTKANGGDTIFWMNLPTGTHIITLEA